MMKDEMDDALKTVAASVFTIGLLIILFLFSVWVGMNLFNWHIASYLNLSPIGMWQIIGISCAIGFFQNKRASIVAIKNLESLYQGMYGKIVVAVMCLTIDCFLLLIGWMAK